MKQKFVAYGSLKSDKYNHSYFDMTLIKKVEKLGGFRMYSLGAYPAVVLDPQGIIEDLEILEVNNEYDWERIKAMEYAAGYDIQNVNIDGEELPMFVINKYDLSKYERISKF